MWNAVSVIPMISCGHLKHCARHSNCIHRLRSVWVCAVLCPSSLLYGQTKVTVDVCCTLLEMSKLWAFKVLWQYLACTAWRKQVNWRYGWLFPISSHDTIHTFIDRHNVHSSQYWKNVPQNWQCKYNTSAVTNESSCHFSFDCQVLEAIQDNARVHKTTARLLNVIVWFPCV